MKTYSRGRRICSRCLFYALKSVAVLISYVSHRVYMRLYIPLLAFSGMHLTGKPRYIAKNVYFDDFRGITLGERVVISTNVRFLTHDYSATTALLAVGERPPSDIAVERPISVGNNVFIGLGSLILPSTEIGDDVIIGAGSVVRGKIPPRSVVIGNPATVIGTIDEYAERCKSQIASGRARMDAAAFGAAPDAAWAGRGRSTL